MALSRQTPPDKFFRYNPFAGAQVHIFPADRPDKPRVFILKPDPVEQQATAANGKVRLFENEIGQPVCIVKGKYTERFSIVWPGRKKKKPFSTR